MTARHLLVSFLIVLAGCESAPQELTPEEALARVASSLVATTCEKDPALIAQASDTMCSTDEDCAAAIAGTFCNLEEAHCDSNCDGAARGCGAGETCDCSGRCVPTTSVPPPPTVEPPTVILGTKAFDPATHTGDFSCPACHKMATEN